MNIFFVVAWIAILVKMVFFCEFCEIIKNNFFTEHLMATARLLFVIAVSSFICF